VNRIKLIFDKLTGREVISKAIISYYAAQLRALLLYVEYAHALDQHLPQSEHTAPAMVETLSLSIQAMRNNKLAPTLKEISPDIVARMLYHFIKYGQLQAAYRIKSICNIQDIKLDSMEPTYSYNELLNHIKSIDSNKEVEAVKLLLNTELYNLQEQTGLRYALDHRVVHLISIGFYADGFVMRKVVIEGKYEFVFTYNDKLKPDYCQYAVMEAKNANATYYLNFDKGIFTFELPINELPEDMRICHLVILDHYPKWLKEIIAEIESE
jgi:hypothetical protein